jgi:hypothetical protein
VVLPSVYLKPQRPNSVAPHCTVLYCTEPGDTAQSMPCLLFWNVLCCLASCSAYCARCWRPLHWPTEQWAILCYTTLHHTTPQHSSEEAEHLSHCIHLFPWGALAHWLDAGLCWPQATRENLGLSTHTVSLLTGFSSPWLSHYHKVVSSNTMIWR